MSQSSSLPLSGSPAAAVPAPVSYAQWVSRAVAIARGAQGRPVVNLFESSVPEPRDLLRTAVLATVSPDGGAGFSPRYVSAFGEGNPFVRAHVARAHGVALDQVLCNTGATAGLSLLYRALLRPGDRVLVETPGFDLFATAAQIPGVSVDTFPRRAPAFDIDPAELAAAITPQTRLIVLSDLHNPSGMGLSQARLAELAELAARAGAWLVVDEVYGDYADPATRPGPATRLSDAVISLSSLTKIYGLGVLRCGWIVGSAPVMARLRDHAARSEFGVSTLSHAVAAEVLLRTDEADAHWRAHVSRSAPRFAAWFAAMVAQGLMAGTLPDAGCICFPRLVGIDDTRAFSEALMAQSGVIVAPGEFFGLPGHVRIGFCLPDAELDAGLAGLEAALRRHRAGQTTAAQPA